MFSFFKKKPPAPAAAPAHAPAPDAPDAASSTPVSAPAPAAAPAPAPGLLARWFGRDNAPAAEPVPPAPVPALEVVPPAAEPAMPEPAALEVSAPVPMPVPEPMVPPPVVPTQLPPVAAPTPVAPPLPVAPVVEPEATAPAPEPEPALAPAARVGWLDRLKKGLRKTGSSIATVFTGTRIDDALYEELEEALLLADTGVGATEHLLADLKRRVKDAKATEPSAVKALLADAIADLLRPLQKSLVIGEATPTVVMVAGVNGAGKTTTIGKLTRYLADADQKVLLAAADTFRAAAREQLAVWADRTRVEVVSQQGGDPAAVTFDAVSAGRARGVDVVIADTAGRLPTQLHLMEELKKIRRTIGKAQEGAPHEVLLVVDGNTGQNALAQVKAFDAALGLTGLIVTKLDGTAKGGVLAAIARWGSETGRVVPVYFIGVGERVEDLQPFDAREFAQALLD